ncbi:MAG: hypothetical protein L0227_03700 [Chloroflexi bacterium]|nr:hypothetical protein [Chloroflexota bacterium]
MRRVITALATVTALALGATPSIAAETFHHVDSGMGLSAGFTNAPDEGPLEPGTYFATWVDSSSSVGFEEHSFGNGVCVYHVQVTVIDEETWVYDRELSACAEGSTLTIDRRLDRGRVVATIPDIERCLLYDEETWECLETELLGTVELDVTIAGVGPIYRSHDAGSGGTAGDWQYAYHGTGASREGIPSGTVDLTEPDGDVVSLVAGATVTVGSLWNFRSGGVEISIAPFSEG